MQDRQSIADFQNAVNVSRETIDRLVVYESLLKKWNPAINLVSRGTLNDVWGRHFLDSAQLWRLRPAQCNNWLDIGSGAGFPGLVIAAIAAQQTPDLTVTLVESDQRKAAFLSTAAATLNLTVKIVADRIENLPNKNADVLTARAMAPLTQLLEISANHMRHDGVALFHKGKNSESELTLARKYWTFELHKTPSVTASAGVILQIKGVRRA